MAAVLLCVFSILVIEVFVFPVSSAGGVKCPSTCFCLGNLVDCSSRGLIEVPKDVPSWVTRLELQDNGISAVTSSDFIGLNNLSQLDLSNNEIRLLNESVFQNLPSLTHLKMNANKLTEIPKFKGIPLLTSLELKNNRIHTLTVECFNYTRKLRNLELSHNQIMDIPPGVFPINNTLTKLTLNGNRLDTFDDGCLDNLTSLETLKMNKNQISQIPKTLFSKLTSLKVLEMTKNQIKKIDGLVFSNLTSLQVLKLRKNIISDLKDGAFWGLVKMQNLQLDYNNISNVTKGWLFRMESLRQITLAHNRISIIQSGSWELCQLLQSLDLSNNRLTTIHRNSFSKLKNLNILKLGNNFISNIEDGSFRDLTKLKSLELNNNEISWTIEDKNEAFIGLENILELGLESNKIKSIASNAFADLEQLTALYLGNNAITSIQANALDPRGSLRTLTLNSSSFLCDCHLAWLPEWLKSKDFQKSVKAECAHPQVLKGKSIFIIDPDLFKCEGVPLKPVITADPKSKIGLKNENITLECSAASTQQSQMRFTWKKDNLMIVNPVVMNYEKTDGQVINYTSVLHLNRIQDSHAGQYKCIISNEFGSAYSKAAEISVHVYPMFIKMPVDVTVKSGTTARLECDAKGQPVPTIAWQKDGGDDFPAARERRMHVMPTDDVFFIVNVKDIDQGVYSCTAKNDAGVITANATLTVLQTPSFKRPMERHKYSRTGQTTVLECMAAGSPKPKLRWLKDGQPLGNNQRYFFTAENQLLIIVQTQKMDHGTYTCELSNTLGNVAGSTELKVYASASKDGERAGASHSTPSGPSDESTTTGIIIIAVVCCVVGTSLVWVIIIYQTRKRHEMYSATPTDETTLPGEIPSSGYTSSDKEGSFTQTVQMTGPLYNYQDYQMKESGYESSSGRFRAARVGMYTNDLDEDNHQSVPLTLGEHQLGHHSSDNSESSLHYPNSETDSLKSSHSTGSTHTSSGGQPTTLLRTFHPTQSNQNSLSRSVSASAAGVTTTADFCENCDRCQNVCTDNNVQLKSVNNRHSLNNCCTCGVSPSKGIHHGSLPQPPGRPHELVLSPSDCVCDNCTVEGSSCSECRSSLPSSVYNNSPPVRLVNNTSVCNHNKTPSPSPSYSGPQSSLLSHTQTTSSTSPVSHSGPRSPHCHSSSLHNSPEKCPPPYNMCVSKENHCHRDNNHRDSNHRNNKIPPAIPPKQHRLSRTHSSNSSLQNGLTGRSTMDL